jgi:dihydroflavonol-4-reductase
MRVLITGANGFLGTWLARALAARGDSVRALVRRGSDLSSLSACSVELAEGDVTQPGTLAAALEGVEVCFHLAGVRRGTARADFMRVNAGGTRHVAEAMVQTGARRLVLCGSLAAAGPCIDGRPRTEEDPLQPEEWYGESKAEAERIAFGFSHQLEVTSIRPCRILGPGDRENLTFFKVVKRGWVMRLLGPPRPLSLVDVEDVVGQLLLQADRPEAKGQAFFCAGEETATVEEMMRQMARTLGVRARTVPLPPRLLRVAGALADVLSDASGYQLPLNRKLVRQLLAPGWTCSTEKAHRLLGFRAKWALSASLDRSAASYAAAGWL